MKIKIVVLWIVLIGMVGCSDTSTKNKDKDDTAVIEDNPVKIEKPDFLDNNPSFFNQNFTSDKQGNVYFMYFNKLYKINADKSLEVLLEAENLNLTVNGAKYHNGYIFTSVYFSKNPSYKPGILRMNLSTGEFKLFETPNCRPYYILIDNNIVYMQVWDYDVNDTRFAVADFNSDTAELSDFIFTDKDDDPYTIQSDYVASEYDLYESYESKKRITNFNGDYVYIFNNPAIFKINLKTKEKQEYYLSDMYGINGLIDSNGVIEVIGNKIYTSGNDGVACFNDDFSNMELIIDNRRR